MRLTAGLDSGPVCLQAREPIRPDDDYGTLAARLQALGGDLLVRALDERPPWVEQDEAGVTYAEKIEAADRALDPTRRPRRSSASCARCARTSARGCRCPDGALPRRARARACRRARRSRRPAAACAPTASGCCSTAAAARSS